MVSGFKKSLLRGNVVDLAIAVVIGAAFNNVVQALVKDIITPLIGAFGGIPDFSTLSFTANRSEFLIGDFINAVLSFLILATVVYFFVVLPVNRLMDVARGEPPTGPVTRECPWCLSKIPLKAQRCAFCTQAVAPVEPGPAATQPVAARPGNPA